MIKIFALFLYGLLFILYHLNMRVSLEEAHRLLLSGHVVALPTETVYGLAASIERPGAVDQIFSLKGRPSNNPLIIHGSSAEQIAPYLKGLPEDFSILARTFWPGPLTLVLEVLTDLIPEKVRAGLPTAGFRIPEHSLTRALTEWVGPLVMPSANRSGSPSSTCVEHVEEDFGPNLPVLDGGVCAHGLESTIMTFREGGWKIIRKGAIPAEAFLSVLGYLPEYYQSDKPICPGQMYRHYAPKADLTLCSNEKECSGVVLGYTERHYLLAERVIEIGSILHPEEVAENLYRVLRQLDQENIKKASIDINIPSTGIWATIQERLMRAAQKG